MLKLAFQIFLMLMINMVIMVSCNKNEQGELKMKEAKASDLANLERQLNDYLDEKEELVAIAFQDVDQKFYLGLNDTISLHAASTMKVPVMMEVYHQADSGIFEMEDSIIIRNEFKSIIDNSPYSLDINEDGGERLYSLIGSKESIRSLVNEMITYSGNLATNLLVEMVNAKNVQKFMESLGAHDILVLRGVEDIKAYRAGKNNTTTAQDLAKIFQAIYDGQNWTEKSRNEMIDILLAQQYNNKIPAKLPSNVKIAHKTGSITKIDHDCGIVYPKNSVPYVLVVLTRGFENHTEAQECIADISKMIYNWYITE